MKKRHRRREELGLRWRGRRGERREGKGEERKRELLILNFQSNEVSFVEDEMLLLAELMSRVLL